MKYMIMTFGDMSGLEGRSTDWIRGMIEFMIRIDVELSETGELVFQQGLANAPEAITVQVAEGTHSVARGPVEAPPLAGFWVVDVADEARAIEIAGRISEAADARIEVRACMDAPPDDVLQQMG
ncbi:MAG: YciI family protein [Chloroflexota bacterium]